MRTSEGTGETMTGTEVPVGQEGVLTVMPLPDAGQLLIDGSAPMPARDTQVVLDEFNSRLAGKIPYKLYLAKAREIDFLEKNARFMKKEQFEALTRNIKNDGGLTSLPLCYLQENGRLLVLSGNHRLKAAIAAGIQENLVLLIDKPLSKQRQIAIQLSHNAIAGQDDEQVLKELWMEIDDLEASIYSGLSNELIEKLTNVDFKTIAEQRPLFKEIALLFLPDEIEQMKSICEGILESVKSKNVMAGRISEYSDLLDGIIAVKQNQKIINSTIAFFALAKVAREYLDGKLASIQEGIEEGVEDTIIFNLGSTRKRIKKDTAKVLRKALKDKADAGLDLDQALIEISEK